MLAVAATVGAVQTKRSFGQGADQSDLLVHLSAKRRPGDHTPKEATPTTAVPSRPPKINRRRASSLSRKRPASAIDLPPALPATTFNDVDANGIVQNTQRRVVARVAKPLISWAALPSALWIKIFSMVSYYDRMSIPLVCKSWRHLASEWRMREVRIPGGIFSDHTQLQVRPAKRWGDPSTNNLIRAFLVDWLMEVASDYSLLPSTLFLGINFMDRFLSAFPMDRASIQGVGAACLWIASKFEEQVPPTLSDFVYVGKTTYTGARLVNLEAQILHRLGFQLSVPTVLHFLNEYLGMLRLESPVFISIAKVRPVALFLLTTPQLFAELALLDFALSVDYCPSAIAAASIYMALNVFKRIEADHHAERLAALSAYKPQDPELLACCKRFMELIPLLQKTSTPRISCRTLRLKYDNTESCDAWRLVMGAEFCIPESH